MFYCNHIEVDICLKDGYLIIGRVENHPLLHIEQRYLLKVTKGNGSLVIHYVMKKKTRSLHVKSIIIYGSEMDLENVYSELAKTLKERPERLLVIINPNSGKKKGVKVFQKFAAPLLKLCGVTADVIVTRKQKEPTEILNDYDLSQIDGIVAVGGDGLYCECMNGLVTRVQRDHYIDFNSHHSNVDPVSLPIGIIPAGSGDVIVQYLHGTRCPRTAVLHILLGNHVDSNIVSVHAGGKLLSYSALVLGFGLFGDMMYHCEKFRWMGPSRFNVVPLGCMLKRRELEVEVEYHSSQKDENLIKRGTFGRQISLPNGLFALKSLSRKHRTKSTSDLLTDGMVTSDCQKERGRVYAVDSHAIMMKEKEGKMKPRFGQESLMVYTTYTCPLTDHILQLTKVKNEKPGCYNYKFVSQHAVSGYRVRLLNPAIFTSCDKQILQKDYYINCDGEVIRLQEPVFDVKLHRKAVKFYGDVEG